MLDSEAALFPPPPSPPPISQLPPRVLDAMAVQRPLAAGGLAAFSAGVAGGETPKDPQRTPQDPHRAPSGPSETPKDPEFPYRIPPNPPGPI